MKKVIGVALLVWTIVSSNLAFGSVILDYSDDIANGNFVGFNPVAKLALDAAVSDIESAITSSFSPILNSLKISAGTNGGTSASFTSSLSYTNPTHGISTIYNPPGITFLVSNEIRLFVGSQSLVGNTLGQGGPGGVSLNFGASTTGNPASEFPGAVAAGVATQNAAFHRGGASPVISSVTVGTRKSLTQLGVAFSHDLNFTTVTSVPEPSSVLMSTSIGIGLDT